jgi:hypothetical protein
MLDVRKTIRRRAIGEYYVFDRTNDQLIGQIVNMSSKGILIKTKEALAISSNLRCRIELPKDVLKGEQIAFDAEIRWCKKADIEEKEEYYEAGCVMRNISKAGRKVIDSLLHIWMVEHSRAINKAAFVVKKK